MKKLLLTTLVLFTALQGFSQNKRREVQNFVMGVMKEAVPNNDTMLILNTLDSMVLADPTEDVVKVYRNVAKGLKKEDFFLESIENSAKKNKDSLEIQAILGMIYEQDLEFKKALKQFNICLKQEENIKDTVVLSRIYEEAGESYKMLGNFKQAEEYYKKAIKLDSTMYFTYHRLANLLNQLEKPDEAISILNYVESDSFDKGRHSEYPSINYTYGYAYYLKGDYKKAINYLKEQINTSRDWASTYLIAKSYQKLGDTGNACAYFNMFLDKWNSEIADTIPEKLKHTYYIKKISTQLKDAQKQIEELNCE